MKNLTDIIVETPGTCAGKPRIRGRRITVELVKVYYDHHGMTPEEIAVEFDLELHEVHAALAYYFLNAEVINVQMEARQARYEKAVEEAGASKPQDGEEGAVRLTRG